MGYTRLCRFASGSEKLNLQKPSLRIVARFSGALDKHSNVWHMGGQLRKGSKEVMFDAMARLSW